MSNPEPENPEEIARLLAIVVPATKTLPDTLLSQYKRCGGNLLQMCVVLEEARKFSHLIQHTNILAGENPHPVLLEGEERVDALVRMIEGAVFEICRVLDGEDEA